MLLHVLGSSAGRVYAACAISRVSPSAGMRPILGYIVAPLIGTIIVAAVPGLSTGFIK